MRRAGNRVVVTLQVASVLCAMLALGGPRGAAAATVSPLPESDYSIRAACQAPTPGRAACLALELQPQTPAAQERAHPIGMTSGTPITAGLAADGADGLRPEDLRAAYFPGEEPDVPASDTPQTIALVDAYNDYEAEKDLRIYDEEFKLPALASCATSQQSDCFEQVNQSGESTASKPPFPSDKEELRNTEDACLDELELAEIGHTEISEAGERDCFEAIEAGSWSIEISTDIEVSHAVCQNCRIVLVEADSAGYEDLEKAEKTAAIDLKATEISNSWGGREEGSDSHAFEYAGTVVTAAAGDDGYLNWTEAAQAKEAEERGEKTGYFVGADYPASAPGVVAVGGTKLTMSAGARQSETVWNEDPDPKGKNDGAGGGGCSQKFTAPAWQQAVPDWSQIGCGSKRAVADIAADADPYTGVAVYDSVSDLREENEEIVRTPPYWEPIGGTSVASPIIASMFALAGGAHATEVQHPAETLYSHLETTALYNVTKGGNGSCDDLYSACAGSMELASSAFPLDCGESSLICNAAPGCGDQYYDGPTGVGTPNGIATFKPGAQPAIVKRECAPTSKPSKEEVKKEEGRLGEGGSKASEQPTNGVSIESGASGSNNSGTGAGSPSGSTGVGSTPTETHATSPPAPARVTALALTADARTALRRGQLTVSQVAFSCALNRPTLVHVTLARQVRSSARAHWRTLSPTLSIAAIAGLNRRHLRGSAGLAPGLYRLTLTPAGGAPLSITFRLA
jgi:hypothetical protein